MKELFYIDIEFGQKVENKQKQYDHYPMSGLSYMSKTMSREKFLEIKKNIEEFVRQQLGELT